MGRFLSHIPGFRTGNPRHRVLAGVYYLFSLSMMLVSVALGFLLLSGPFLVFNGHAAIEKYNESKNAKALTALFLSAAICGASLIGFVMDMTGRQGDTPVKMAASADETPYTTPYATPVAAVIPQTPETSLPPSPAGLPLEKAVVLGYTADGIHVQYEDESAGDIRLAGIEIDTALDAAGYMEGTLPPGSIVYLERDSQDTGCYVWMEEPFSLEPGEFRGKTLNTLLAANGYAMARGNPTGQYADVLAACQDEAEAACIGLWAVSLESTAAATQAPEPEPSSPRETEQAPAPAPEEPPAEPPSGGVYYCGSKNSDVFHLSTCGSVSQISPENLVIYSSREDAISQGKRPCKKCNP